MKRLLTILALGVLLTTTLLASEPRSHIDEASVMQVTAINAGDGAAIANLYNKDAALFPPGAERIDGRSAIQAFWQGAIDSGMKVDDLHVVEVDARSDIAVDVGNFTISVPADSGVTKAAGKYIVIWKRIDHTWQIYREIWNMN